MHESRIRGRRPVAVAAALALVVAPLSFGSTAYAALPDAPDGWTEVWSDDFTGAADTLPSSANWIIDKGTSFPGGAPNWGTGEIQTYTDSTDNLSQDGAGNLSITPIKDGSGGWTSARIETVPRTSSRPRAAYCASRAAFGCRT